MAQRRPIDVAVIKVYGAMLMATVGFIGFLTFWVALTRAGNQQAAPFMNTAFVLSWLIAMALNAGILEYARRRSSGTPVTWGEANVGAVYVFFLLFWIYGVVPHQFLTYADNELAWRIDRLLVGPGLGFADGQGLLSWILPFEVTYLAIRDILVVVVYGLALAGNVAMFNVWQNRGAVAPTEVEQSTYGRPLVKEGV